MTENRRQKSEIRNQTIGVRSQETSASSVEPSGVSNQQSAVEYLFSKLQTPNSKLLNEKGIALVMALIISFAVMVAVTSALYFTIQATNISGSGKRYSTAEEAADGAVGIIEEAIDDAQNAKPRPDIINDPTNCFLNAAITGGINCVILINLPGDVGNNFTAEITFQRLFQTALPGSRIAFGRAAGAPAVAVYFRIIVSVTDLTNTARAENSVLYRFTG